MVRGVASGLAQAMVNLSRIEARQRGCEGQERQCS